LKRLDQLRYLNAKFTAWRKVTVDLKAKRQIYQQVTKAHNKLTEVRFMKLMS